MGFLLSICLLLTVMSYFSATNNSFMREYVLQVHDFSTPYFHFGICYEDMGCDDQEVNCLRIGFIFIVIKITTYRHTAATLEQYPFLKGVNQCKWQQLWLQFLYSLDLLPQYKDNNDME